MTAYDDYSKQSVEPNGIECNVKDGSDQLFVVKLSIFSQI